MRITINIEHTVGDVAAFAAFSAAAHELFSRFGQSAGEAAHYHGLMPRGATRGECEVKESATKSSFARSHNPAVTAADMYAKAYGSPAGHQGERVVGMSPLLAAGYHKPGLALDPAGFLGGTKPAAENEAPVAAPGAEHVNQETGEVTVGVDPAMPTPVEPSAPKPRRQRSDKGKPRAPRADTEAPAAEMPAMLPTASGWGKPPVPQSLTAAAPSTPDPWATVGMPQQTQAPAAHPKPAAPTADVGAIRAACLQLVSKIAGAGKVQQLAPLVRNFKVSNFSEVPAERVPELHAALEAVLAGNAVT